MGHFTEHLYKGHFTDHLYKTSMHMSLLIQRLTLIKAQATQMVAGVVMRLYFKRGHTYVETTAFVSNEYTLITATDWSS